MSKYSLDTWLRMQRPAKEKTPCERDVHKQKERKKEKVEGEILPERGIGGLRLFYP